MTRINLLQNVSIENTQEYIDSFRTADTDANGFLDSQELRAAFGRRNANRMLRHADYFTGNDFGNSDPLTRLPIPQPDQPDRKLSLAEFSAYKINNETNGDHRNHNVFKGKDDKDYMKFLIRQIGLDIYFFDRLDTNHNGIVETVDGGGAPNEVSYHGGEFTLAQMITRGINYDVDYINNRLGDFNTIDINQNGELSKRELGIVFDSLDTNHDGLLTEAEQLEHWRNRSNPLGLLPGDDLTKNRYIALALERYDHYKNNKISTGEFVGLWYGVFPGE